ncbi:MAG: nicotinate (nicotinamide) nucleotide adenylyltransferase [Bacteroidales bacterium]|nr:nicotinate (nicotinamide) nucleotide adenylyltransferase [Bacteroidales bacterium]MDD4671043.1 nicotinate (nicotinamide) nucleotide adenylyltransferase [Bacteroidales bacterium]
MTVNETYTCNKVALFFGSFNPIHVGHIAISKYVRDNCRVHSVRLIVSPQNPIKSKNNVSARKRLEAAREAVAKNGLDIEVSDVEFHLRKPLYTIRTLRYLRKNEPQFDHVLVIGADNLAIIENWYRWKEILDEFEIWVYPREGFNLVELCDKYKIVSNSSKITPLDAPLYNISSTFIRESEAKGEDMSRWKV